MLGSRTGRLVGALDFPMFHWNPCGKVQIHLDWTISYFFFYLCETSFCSLFLLPQTRDDAAVGSLCRSTCTGSALSGWRVFTCYLCRHIFGVILFILWWRKRLWTAHSPEEGEMEMGFSNFLCFWLLRGSLTVRAPRTSSSPPLCGGRFAHYLVSASLIKEAVIVSAPCHKSTKTFSVKESVRAAFMILYSTTSGHFSCLLSFVLHHLSACLLLSMVTSVLNIFFAPFT